MLLDIAGKKPVTVPTVLLHAVHGRLGVHEQDGVRDSVTGAECNAQRARHDKLVAQDPDRPANLGENAHCPQGHLVLAHARQCGYEMIARQTGQGILIAQQTAHADGHLAQQRVADRMTERIVDPAKVIQVQPDDGQRLFVVQRHFDSMRQHQFKRRAVWQASERIKVGQFIDSMGGFNLRSDVFLVRQVIDDPSALVAHRIDQNPLGVFGTILATIDELPLPGFAARKCRPKLLIALSRRFAGLEQFGIAPDQFAC